MRPSYLLVLLLGEGPSLSSAEGTYLRSDSAPEARREEDGATELGSEAVGTLRRELDFSENRRRSPPVEKERGGEPQARQRQSTFERQAARDFGPDQSLVENTEEALKRNAISPEERDVIGDSIFFPVFTDNVFARGGDLGEDQRVGKTNLEKPGPSGEVQVEKSNAENPLGMEGLPQHHHRHGH